MSHPKQTIPMVLALILMPLHLAWAQSAIYDANQNNTLTLPDGAVVENTGNNSYALWAREGGVLNAVGSLTISTNGLRSYAVYVMNTDTAGIYNQPAFTGGDNIIITTEGKEAYGIYGMASNATSGATLTFGNGLNISTTGDLARAVQANGNGVVINIGTGAVLASHGYQSGAAWAQNGGVINIGANADLSISEWDSAVVYAQTNGIINIGDNSVLRDVGDRTGYVVHVMSGGQVNLGNYNQITSGHDFGFGAYVYGSYNNQVSTLTTGDNTTFSTKGYWAHGLYLQSGSATYLGKNNGVETDGDSAFGIGVIGTNTHFQSGDGLTVITHGDDSEGIYVSTGNAEIGNNATIQTAGNDSYAFFVTSQGRAAMGNGGSIITTGQNSVGVFTYQGTPIEIGNSLNVETAGTNAYGIYLANNDTRGRYNQPTITAGDNITVVTAGANAYGVYSLVFADTSGGPVTLGDGLTVSTGGDGARAVFADGEGALITIGDRATIITAGEEAYGLSVVSLGTVALGKDGRIKTSGSGSHAIYLNNEDPDGARPPEITLGEKITLVTEGADAYGVYVLAAEGSTGATMDLHNDLIISTSGNHSRAVLAQGDGAVINIGDRALIQTAGIEAYGLSVTAKGSISMGSDGRVETSGVRGFGIYLYNEDASGAHGQPAITVGNNLTIVTEGDEGHAVYVTAVAGSTGATMDFNGLAVATGGNVARGVVAAGPAAEINITGTGVIQTTGNDSAAVYAVEGGMVTLIGKQTLTVDPDASDYVVYAQSVAAGQVANVTAEGELTVVGGVVAADDAYVAMNFAAGSVFTGYTAMLQNTAGSEPYVDFTMTDTTWNVTQDSRMRDLKTQHSVIGFVEGGDFKTLTVANLSGSDTTFNMITDIAALSGDLLVVTGTSAGDYFLKVKNDGSVNVTGAERLTVVETSDGGAGFSLTNVVELGGFEYLLAKENTNWVLYGTEKVTGGGSAAFSSFMGGAYLLSYAENQTLMQRLGDLHAESEGYGGNLWIKGYGGRFDSSGSKLMYGFDMNYYGMQTGADFGLHIPDVSGKVYVGAVFGYVKGDFHFDPKGRGNVDRKTAGIYGTYISDYGFYADAVLKYGWMENEYHVLNSASEMVHGGTTHTHGLGASLEVGRRFYLDAEQAQNGFYLEPQAELSYIHQNGGKFHASDGLRVSISDFDSLQGRLGLQAGYDALVVDDVRGSVYLKGSYVNEFQGDVRGRLNDTRIKEAYGGDWFAYGVGASLHVGENHHLYVDYQRSEGGRFRQPWAVNAGYRLTF